MSPMKKKPQYKHNKQHTEQHTMQHNFLANSGPNNSFINFHGENRSYTEII